MNKSLKALFILSLLPASLSWAGGRKSTPAADKISVMTYNVENLFDTENDPDKNDDTYLPIEQKQNARHEQYCREQNHSPSRVRECLTLDWSEEVLDRKLTRLADVVAQVNNGKGPDILIVEEVESLSVLELWRDKYLRNMGYQTIAYVKGPDERGINPAILSRLPLAGRPLLHPVDLSRLKGSARPTRSILEATLKLPTGENLNVFALHFPSQQNPLAYRDLALQTLMSATANLPTDAQILVGGDFNITSKEEAAEHFFRNVVSPKFTVSHLAGCQECRGTVYYPAERSWSFFDVLLFSPNLDDHAKTWQLDRSSIRIINSSAYQNRKDGTPAHFGEGKSAIGVSDHWPMYAELNRL